MKKFKSKAGYVVYAATVEDTEKLGGCGICDRCNKPSKNGYLIAVLNSYFCPECYEDWDNNFRMYEEDLPIEARRVTYYDKVFGLEA